MHRGHPASELLYGRPLRRYAKPREPANSAPSVAAPPLEPSAEFAKADGEVRHLKSNAQITSLTELSELYRRLANESQRLDEHGWRVESCKRGRRACVVPPD